jgi:Na+-transporting methylmalonyl-CoA/oxaloacetate decarboxylase gamma subunit
MGWENVWESNGIGIAVTGLVIVFAALTLISVFIALLPRVLLVLSAILPAESHPPAPSQRGQRDDEELVAAIGVALHHRRTQQSTSTR